MSNYMRGIRKDAPELRKLLRLCIKQGWYVKLAKRGGHMKVYTPDGRMVTVLSATARASGTGVKQFRKILEKEGVSVQ